MSQCNYRDDGSGGCFAIATLLMLLGILTTLGAKTVDIVNRLERIETALIESGVVRKTDGGGD